MKTLFDCTTFSRAGCGDYSKSFKGMLQERKQYFILWPNSVCKCVCLMNFRIKLYF